MLNYDQALQQVLETVNLLPSQSLPLKTAIGLVLAAPTKARWDMPSWDNSAMDGFAFAADSVASSSSLQIVGNSFAGHPFDGELQAGQAIQITTGAPIPAGADSVVPVEETSTEGTQLLLQKAIRKGQHVRYRGEEYRADEVLLEAGTQLQAGAVGMLASAGVDQVAIIPRPKVAIFSTGDELVELGEEPGPGQIVNSNLQYLIARLHECGCIPVPLGIGEDRQEDLTRILDEAQEADLIISTGGVSVGEKDLVQETLLQHGFKRKFWKVAIKPGKPVLFGTLGGKPCFGLPGNPAATAATFEIFARPALRKLAGFPDPLPPRIKVRLAEAVKGGGKRQNFLWGQIQIESGQLVFDPSQRQGSGQNRSLQQAQALLPIAIDSPDLQAGNEVEILLLQMPQGQVFI